MRPLVDVRDRRALVIAAAVGLAVLLGLSAWLWHGSSTGVDDWFISRSNWSHFDGYDSWQRRWLLAFSEPAVDYVILAVVIVLAVVRRDWRLAALTLTAPLLALGLTELIGKPLVDRAFISSASSYTSGTKGYFPSGHETGVVSWLLVAVIIALRLTRDRLVRLGVVLLASWWALMAASGLVLNFYHYATDTVGAMCLTTAVVFSCALGIDAVALAWNSRRFDRSPRAELTEPPRVLDRV